MVTPSYTPTGPWRFVKQIQYVEETAVGSMPTASPLFASPGIVMTYTSSPVNRVIEQTMLGIRGLYDIIKTGEDHSFSIAYRPINTDMLKYGCNDENTGTKNIAKSLSMLFSYKLNNVENYVTLVGCFTNTIAIRIAKGNAVEVTQDFWLNTISLESPTLSPVLTTPTYAPALTGRPLTDLSGGQDPLMVNGLPIDTDEFSVNVAWNPERITPNGMTFAKYIVPTNERITGSFKTWKYDVVNNLLARNNTQIEIDYDLDGGTPGHTITITGAIIDQPSTAHNTGANASLPETFNFRAKGISIS